MAFHSVRFPTSISFGSTAGIERRTEIVRLASGHEERNTAWADARRRYDAGLGVRTLDDLHAVMAFFEARRGMLHAFRWKDWLDHKSCVPSGVPAATDQRIGTGDGETVLFALSKVYEPGPDAVVRPITKPVPGTVRVAVGGSALAAGEGFIVDHETGTLSLAVPPAAGVAVTAGFEFDVPVRFDTSVLEVNIAAFEAGEIPSIPVIEVRV